MTKFLVNEVQMAYIDEIRKFKERVKDLEAALRNILSESKSKAYSPKIVQSYVEQALKGGE